MVNEGQPKRIEIPEFPGHFVRFGEGLQSFLELTGAVLRESQNMNAPRSARAGDGLLGPLDGLSAVHRALARHGAGTGQDLGVEMVRPALNVVDHSLAVAPITLA